MNGRFVNFIYKYQEFFTLLGLGVLFYFIFIHNTWTYALMDVDESRYVSMAKDMFNSKDFMTLYLNNEYFFEKPPLYFWLECLSFSLFGQISEFTARFPVALCGILSSLMTYYTCKKVFTRAYGVVSSLVLATSLEFVILAKFAILDIVVSTCVWLSLCFGMLTYYCEEKNKKFLWWAFYIFSGLAVMAKGIPGFVVPFGSMFLISVVTKRFKEIFKPQYFVVGFIFFFLITIPWHVLMLNIHDPLFFNEYVVKHHLARFLGSSEIGRQQPFWFYFVTILWGFFPWVVASLTVLVRKLIKKDFKNIEINERRQFLIFNGIIAIFTLLFFSSSKTKLITYILPIYGSLACLGGYLWTNYVLRGEYSRVINKTVYFIGGIFTLASIVALFTPLFLPAQLNSDISSAKPLCVTLLFLTGVVSIWAAKKEKYPTVFFVYVIFMLVLSAFGTEKFFKIDYKFGQDDLLKYAQYAKENNKSITTYGFSHKYSLIYYADRHIEYGKNYNIDQLKAALDKKDNLVILLHKRIDDEVKKLDYRIIDDGRKYTLVEKR